MEKKIKGTKGLLITRSFELPVELLWKAWTKPLLFKKWWGPKGFSCPYCVVDLREGGKYLHCLQTRQGENIWLAGTYLQIIPHRKMVFTASFADEEGNIVTPSYYGLDQFPNEMKIAVVFEIVDVVTKLIVHLDMFLPEEIREQVHAGWNESFDKLSAKLKKRTQWS